MSDNNKIIVYFRRLTKGLLLVCWIFVLSYIALLAAFNQSSRFISQRFPALHLGENNYSDLGPAIDNVLDEISKDRYWGKRINEMKRSPKWLEGMKAEVFSKIKNKLISIANDEKIDAANATIAARIISFAFQQEEMSGPPDKTAYEKESYEVYLPSAAVFWVKNERKRQKSEEKGFRLIDTFLLLIAIGAFGSMIFLTKDYLEKEATTRVAAYIFRPIFGMFLAMAMFIIDMVAHSVLSTANMVEIRREPLYLLALTAGLLSEQTYEALNVIAVDALKKFKEKRKITEKKSPEDLSIPVDNNNT